MAFKSMLSCHHHEPKKNGRETAESGDMSQTGSAAKKKAWF